MQENDLTGGVRRRRKSQKSPEPYMKFPRFVQELAATLSIMDGIGIKDGKVECNQPLDTPKSNSKFVQVIDGSIGLFTMVHQ